MVQKEKLGEAGPAPARFFENLDEIKNRVANKEVLVFLDYDGTLTPIVATPDLAVISDEMRETVRKLAGKYKVSIVSGRATDDVRSKVKIDGIFYAGSHGFEIVQPDGTVKMKKEAKEICKTINEAHKKLSGRLKNIKGALVENVKFTISTHYRLVADEDLPKIKQAVEEILKEYPTLRKTQGKKVFELRPKIDWDKGKAVTWILKGLKFNDRDNLVIYIGDDTTDEDAFRVIKDKGFGILVADPPKSSEARYMVKNTEEVKKILNIFIDLKS